jgi:hypothetical protein
MMMAAVRAALISKPFAPKVPSLEANSELLSNFPQEVAASKLVAVTAAAMLAIHRRRIKRSCAFSVLPFSVAVVTVTAFGAVASNGSPVLASCPG